MNIKNAIAARLLAGVAQLTHLSHAYPCWPWYPSHFPHGNAVMFSPVQTAKIFPRKFLIVLYHFCSF